MFISFALNLWYGKKVTSAVKKLQGTKYLLVPWEQIKKNQMYLLQCSNKLPQQVFGDGIQFCRHYLLNVNNHVKQGQFNWLCKQKNVQATQVPQQLLPHYLWFRFHAHYTATAIKTIKLPSSSIGKEMLIWQRVPGEQKYRSMHT